MHSNTELAGIAGAGCRGRVRTLRARTVVARLEAWSCCSNTGKLEEKLQILIRQGIAKVIFERTLNEAISVLCATGYRRSNSRLRDDVHGNLRAAGVADKTNGKGCGSRR